MRCAFCHFYNQTNDKDKSGLCEIKFPPWVDVKVFTDGANIVMSNDSCDLGKKKEDEL